MCLSVYLSVCLSISVSVYLFLSVIVCLCLSVFICQLLSFELSCLLFLFLYTEVCWSVYSLIFLWPFLAVANCCAFLLISAHIYLYFIFCQIVAYMRPLDLVPGTLPLSTYDKIDFFFSLHFDILSCPNLQS